MPALSGPLLVQSVVNEYTVRLADPITDVLYQKGNPVSVARLVKFNYPVDRLFEDRVPEVDPALTLKMGDTVAVRLRLRAKPRVYVAEIKQ